MDFSHVKSMIIPEGNVKQIAVNGVVVWRNAVPVQTFTIHYSTAHGTAPEDKVVEAGYALTSADLPTLSATGYAFNGWDKSVGNIISADTTITASWIAVPSWHTIWTGNHIMTTDEFSPGILNKSNKCKLKISFTFKCTNSGSYHFFGTYNPTHTVENAASSSTKNYTATFDEFNYSGTEYELARLTYNYEQQVNAFYKAGKIWSKVTPVSTTTYSIEITKIEQYY